MATYPTSTVIVAKNGPSAARTYSFIDPALGIMVASSEKLIACRNITSNATPRAMANIQLAAKPCGTVTMTEVATIRPNVAPIEVGSPTACRESPASGVV